MVLIFLCVGLVQCFVLYQGSKRYGEIQRATAIETSDVHRGTLRLPPGAFERNELLPKTSVDARWWVLHTEEMRRNGDWRIRSTSLDNAPTGREVHWSSSVAWVLAGIANVREVLFKDDSVARASYFSGPFLALACFGLLWLVIARGVNHVAAAVFTLVFAVSPLIADCFVVGETDHHGLVCALGAASILSLSFGLATPKSGPWFTVSGVIGGGALWVSAASWLPILLSCAIGGAFVARWNTSQPQFWRTWAIAGAASSLAFYFLEYFPNHLGWRLEVNHPLYAMAWLGIGDLLTRWQTFITTPNRQQAFPAFVRALPALLVAIIPLALIAWQPERFFWVADPFLLALHKSSISEFQSFWASVQGFVVWRVVWEVFAWPIFAICGAGVLLARRGISARWRVPLVVSAVPALAVLGLALAQIRWLSLATGLWLVVSLVLVTGYLTSIRRPAPLAVAWFLLALIPSVFVFPLTRTSTASNTDGLSKQWAQTILMRDVAHRLVQSSPQQLPVVLSGPTTSTDLTYYAGIRTVGTLYWENLAGLRRAGELFAATNAEDLKQQLNHSGVTHIVVASWDDFSSGYTQLLRRDPTNSFLVRLLANKISLPSWLERLDYAIPPEFGIEGEWIAIFRIRE